MTARLTLPSPPQQAEPGSFPLFASLAPVVGALVLYVFLQSPYVLLFALLGPLIAVSSVLDRKIGRGRALKRERARFAEETRLLRKRIADDTGSAMAKQQQRSPGARAQGVRDARHPSRWRWREGPLEIVLGQGSCDTGIRLEEPRESAGEARELYEELAPLAARSTGPVTADAREGVGFFGAPLLTAGLARTALVQVLDAVTPENTTVIVEAGGDWRWLTAAPHNVRFTERRGSSLLVRVLTERGDFTIATASKPDGLPRECGLRVAASAATLSLADGTVVPQVIAQHEALHHLNTLARAASASGIEVAGTLPDHIPLESLPQTPSRGLAATFLQGQNPLAVDIVADGPHAVVGGTTGSGKSELLVSWVAALADAYPSDRLNVLLVDFKGGASFGELQRLRHCVGLMTDLDEAGAVRAIESLKAELRHRERTLAQLGVRSIEETEALPRLLVVVDEFAAMLQELPDLHSLFVDIAARGRSLGVHLILCTQRPADAVRDALMTNCGLRLCLRVNDDHDSVAVVGTPDAAHFELERRGRCAVRIAGSARVIAQAALASEEHILRVVDRSLSGAEPRRPYLPPLPARIEPASVTATAEPGAVVFAYADRPALQRRDAVHWHPRHGSVMIVGSSHSGKTTALQRFCDGTDSVFIDDVESLWDALESPPRASVIAVDDVDLLLMQAGELAAHDMLRELQRRMREASAARVGFVLSARRISGGLSAVQSLAEHTIVLRLPTKQEHTLAGAIAAHNPDLPAGAGWLGDDRIQFVVPAREREPLRARSAGIPAGSLAVVASRLDQLPARLQHGVPPGQEGELIVGTPAQWEAAWGSFDSALNERTVALIDTTDRQLRPLLRGAVQLPICTGSGRWLVRDGVATRLRLGD